MTKGCNGPYLSHFQDQTKTGRNEGDRRFREALNELENPMYVFQKSGCFRNLHIRIGVFGAKIISFEEMLRVAIRIFRDNILRIHLARFHPDP